MFVTAHSSGSDGHVIPVAGWPLGAAVAAQVLVDTGHLVRGHLIRHLQVGVVEGLGAARIHCLQQVLTFHHSNLPHGEFYRFYYLYICSIPFQGRGNIGYLCCSIS